MTLQHEFEQEPDQMAEEAETATAATSASGREGHRAWVRICHWVAVLSFFVLVYSGIFIFAVHPRLYWGEVGNDLVPAILEIPITANHQPEGWEQTATFPIRDGEVYTSSRRYEIFNQNGWARSLHFLGAWFLVVTGLVYLVTGIFSGHARRNLVPRKGDLSSSRIGQDIRKHLRLDLGGTGGGPPYGLLQQLSYFIVVFVLFPLMVLTGMTMSPAITAAFPFLLDVFGGYQSARTIHFFSFATLFLFLVAHVAMVVATGTGRQLRAMIVRR